MEERTKILEMLRDQIISVDEASELLKTIDSQKVENQEAGEPSIIITKEKTVNQKARMLKVRVESVDGDIVNVNIPVSFLKAAIASGSINNLYNKSFNIKGVNKGVIKDSLDIDVLIECIENGYIGDLVDVKTSDGDVVRVYFE